MKRPRVLPLNLSGIGFHSTGKMVAQSYSQGIYRQKCVGLFRYSDWLSRYSHKVGVAKNMQDALPKSTPLEKCVKYQNFPAHFGLTSSLESSGEISQQSIKSTYLINSLKVEVFLQKSNARF